MILLTTPKEIKPLQEKQKRTEISKKANRNSRLTSCPKVVGRVAANSKRFLSKSLLKREYGQQKQGRNITETIKQVSKCGEVAQLRWKSPSELVLAQISE